MTPPPAGSYLSVILSHSVSDIYTIFLLGMGRIVSIVALSPFLGGKALSDPMKMGFGAAITLIFLPFLIITSKGSILLDVSFIFLMIKEVVIGCVMGMIISIPFYVAQSAGALIDHQRGAESLQITDPISQSQTSPFGTFYSNVMLVVFFSTGAIFFFFDALYTSYLMVPPNQFLNADFFLIGKPLWVTMIDLANIVLKITMQLAAPSLMTMLLSDLFLGIANRMAPQVQITFLLYSLKSFMGIGILWIAWWFTLKQLDVEMLSWIKLFQKIVSSW